MCLFLMTKNDKKRVMHLIKNPEPTRNLQGYHKSPIKIKALSLKQAPLFPSLICPPPFSGEES